MEADSRKPEPHRGYLLGRIEEVLQMHSVVQGPGTTWSLHVWSHVTLSRLLRCVFFGVFFHIFFGFGFRAV